MKIYILRHGETDSNVLGLLQGGSDMPLNENGIRLAELCGEGMCHIRFDRCITSPLRRAAHTARIVLDHSGNTNVALEYDDRLIFTQQVQTQRVLAVLCSEGLHYEEVDPKVVDNGTGKPPADLCSLLNTFYLEKGQLRYLREPAKFVHNRTQVAGVRMQYCVSRQEFFLEEGRVSFDGAVPVLHMESRKTVSEGMDLEAEFQLWKQTLPDIVTGTLDEYLAEQAQKYEEARPE